MPNKPDGLHRTDQHKDLQGQGDTRLRSGMDQGETGSTPDTYITPIPHGKPRPETECERELRLEAEEEQRNSLYIEQAERFKRRFSKLHTTDAFKDIAFGDGDQEIVEGSGVYESEFWTYKRNDDGPLSGDRHDCTA